MKKVTNERQAVERMVMWWMLAIILGIAAFWFGVAIIVWMMVKGIIL